MSIETTNPATLHLKARVKYDLELRRYREALSRLTYNDIQTEGPRAVAIGNAGEAVYGYEALEIIEVHLGSSAIDAPTAKPAEFPNSEHY
jgi:hypothetical protein